MLVGWRHRQRTRLITISKEGTEWSQGRLWDLIIAEYTKHTVLPFNQLYYQFGWVTYPRHLQLAMLCSGDLWAWLQELLVGDFSWLHKEKEWGIGRWKQIWLFPRRVRLSGQVKLSRHLVLNIWRCQRERLDLPTPWWGLQWSCPQLSSNRYQSEGATISPKHSPTEERYMVFLDLELQHITKNRFKSSGRLISHLPL